MRTLLLLAALLVAGVRPVAAADGWDRAFWATVPVFGAAAIYDGVQTRTCIRAGFCQELGPTLAPIVESVGVDRAMAIKVGTQAGMVAALAYVQHRWPHQKKYTVLALITMTAVQGVVVMHNEQQLKKVGLR